MDKLVLGLPKLNQDYEGVCKGCTLGKNIKSTFHSSESRFKEIVELIHSDLCGTMFVASRSGYWYYISFIDDFSQCWVYFLNSKESNEVFVKTKAQKSIKITSNKKERKLKQRTPELS